MDGDGSPIDLSNRKDEFTTSDNQTVGGLQTVLTDAQAAQYVIGNVLNNSDNWDPLIIIENTEAPVITSDANDIKWNKVDYAISYLVMHNDSIIASTKEISFAASVAGKYKVVAVAEYGALSTESNELDFVPTAAPLLESSNPTNNATNIAVSGTITLTFNEDVKVGAGDIKLNNVVLTPVVSEKVVTLTYSGLSYATAQSLVIPQGAIQDLAGNDYAGTTISFTTMRSEDTPPLLISSTLNDGDTGVAFKGTITLTFDKPVQAGTAKIRLNGVSLTPECNGNTATVSYQGLYYEKSYKLEIPTGAILNTEGHGCAATTINFVTMAAPSYEEVDVKVVQESGYLTISNIPVQSKVYLYTFSGRRVRSIANPAHTISLPMSHKVMILRIETKKGTKKIKLVKQN